MKNFGLKFHHLGMATDNLKLSMNLLKKAGYKIDKIRFNKNYNVKNALCSSKNQPSIEIVSKVKGKSPIDGILKKHKSSIYHICYITKNLKKTLKKLKKSKIDVIKITDSYLSPFEGVDASFFFIRGIGIVEIMDQNL